jgi:hypothetical protein
MRRASGVRRACALRRGLLGARAWVAGLTAATLRSRDAVAASATLGKLGISSQAAAMATELNPHRRAGRRACDRTDGAVAVKHD